MTPLAGTVVVFLKYPEPGRVKTRIAATVGGDRAAELYRGWIGHVLAALQPLRRVDAPRASPPPGTDIAVPTSSARGEVIPLTSPLAGEVAAERSAAAGGGGDTYHSMTAGVEVVGAIDGAGEEQFAPWVALVDRWWPQPAGDLGARLDAAFREAHEAGAPVVAVGTDCLELDARLVRDAFAMLKTHDAVFGPATDGGYYLVGTSRYLDGFFDAVRWSSPHTLTDHLKQCENRGFSFDLLPTRADIDTWDDWLAYRRRAGGTS